MSKKGKPLTYWHAFWVLDNGTVVDVLFSQHPNPTPPPGQRIILFATFVEPSPEHE